MQLIAVASQRQRWSRDYDTAFKDLFKMQRDVAERVARRSEITLLGAEGQRSKLERTANEARRAIVESDEWAKARDVGAKLPAAIRINRPKDSDFDLPGSRERQRVVIRPLAGARGYRKVQSSKDVGIACAWAKKIGR